MFRTKDGKIEIQAIKSLGDAVFPAADFTLANLPLDHNEAASFATNLYNSPSQRHVLMLFARHSRDEKPTALANLKLVNQAGWKLLETVCVWYEKPSTSSNIGFLPVAEEAYIFYKGATPNVKNTEWFSPDGGANATNLWDLTPNEFEGKSFTYYRHFAWEIPLLLATLVDPAETCRFIYALDGDYDHVFKFCREHKQQVSVLLQSEEQAKKLIQLAKMA